MGTAAGRSAPGLPEAGACEVNRIASGAPRPGLRLSGR